MATYYLINRIKFGGNVLCPGTLLDSVSEDVTGIQAAGGVLVASSDPIIAAAAVQAQGARVNGAADQLVDTIMASAYVAYAISLASTIDASELGTGAVTEAKIGAAAVTEAKIGTGAVTAAKLGTGSVTATKLGTDNASVDEIEHDDGASPATLLAAASVTRLVEVTAVCSETLAGSSTVPTFKVGWAASDDGVLTIAELAPTTGGGDSGDVTTGRAILPADAALICTYADGTGGSEAGIFTFYSTAVPMPTP